MANAIPIRMKYTHAIMPITFLALLPTLVEMTCRAAQGLRDPDHPDADLPPSVEGV